MQVCCAWSDMKGVFHRDIQIVAADPLTVSLDKAWEHFGDIPSTMGTKLTPQDHTLFRNSTRKEQPDKQEKSLNSQY